MKIGDLVKYDKSLSGLEKCMGVIIGFDGQAIMVQWLDRYSDHPARTRVALPEKSVELPEFLEVVSENR